MCVCVYLSLQLADSTALDTLAGFVKLIDPFPPSIVVVRVSDRIGGQTKNPRLALLVNT